jgi:WD40 repeat protein
MIKAKSLVHIILIASVAFLISCGQSVKKQPPANEGTADWQYFGLSSPGETPQMFSPEIISTKRNERDFTISPAGNIMFYSMVLPAGNFSVILYLHFDGFFWSEPEVAGFSGQYSDLEPAYSPDGKKLACVSQHGGGTYHLFIANADGSNPQQITSGGTYALFPAFSPDSKYIAICSDNEISIIDLSNNQVVKNFSMDYYDNYYGLTWCIGAQKSVGILSKAKIKEKQ